MAIPDLLRACPLFFELYDSEVERIVRFCSVFSFAPGQSIVRDGEEGSQVFVLLNGSARIQKTTPNGIVHIQALGGGDVFGEMVLVDERKRSADIVCINECDVLEIRYDDIFKIFQTEPRIFGLILLNLSRLLAKRIKASNQLISELKRKGNAAA